LPDADDRACFRNARAKAMSGGCGSFPADSSLGRRVRRVLWLVMALNLAMFGVEIVYALREGSTAMQADAADFLIDSAAYLLTLCVLAKSGRWQAGAALAKGVIMAGLGIAVLVGLAYRLIGESALPHPMTMGAVGATALAVNMLCAALLFFFRGENLNLRSVWLCSRNDALGNLGVIAAGIGVYVTRSYWPDLVVGAAISGLIFAGAWSVIHEATRALRSLRPA
jgi:cation diffusion facilitator family transporter